MMFVPDDQLRSDAPVLHTWTVCVVVVDGGWKDCRLVGDTSSAGAPTALPSRATMVVGSAGAALTMVSTPLCAPGEVGANPTVTGIEPPGGIATGGVSPVCVKSPVMEAPVIWRTSVPTFLMVVVSVRVNPT